MEMLTTVSVAVWVQPSDSRRACRSSGEPGREGLRDAGLGLPYFAFEDTLSAERPSIPLFFTKVELVYSSSNNMGSGVSKPSSIDPAWSELISAQWRSARARELDKLGGELPTG